MKIISYLGLTLLLAALVTNAWHSLAQGTHSADEAAIRRAGAEWSQAASAKDVDKAVSFYADDASMLPYAAPIATGKEQIRQNWMQLMAIPGANLIFASTKIVVAKAGDMAYDLGTFSMKANDAQGNATTTVGKYVVVWRKQPTGQWKAVADIFNTDK